MAIDFSKYKNNSRIDFSEKYDGSYKLKGEEFIKQYNALINTNLDTKFNNPENYRSLVGNSRTLKNYADNNKDALIKYFGNDKYKDIIKQIDNSHNNLVYGLHLSEAVDLQNDVSTALQNWGDKTKLKELKNKAAGVSQRLSSYANMQGANQDYKKQLNLKQINDVVNYNASMAQNMENIFNQYKSKDEYDTALKSYQFLNKYNGKTYADIKNILNTSNQLAEDERKWLNSYQYEVMTEDEINKELSSIEANVNSLREQIKKDDAISGGSQKQLMPNSMTAEQKAAFERIQQNTNKINELSSLEQLLKTNLAQKTQLREFEEKWKESAGKKGSVSYENPFDKYAEDLGIGLNDQEFAGYLTNKKYFDLMTEDEKNSYDWIMENKGEDQALEYFNDLVDARLDKRYNEDIIKNTFNYASSGGWQGALSTLGSVVTSLSSGLEYAVNTLSGNSDRRSTFSSMTSGLREGTKSNWEGAWGEDVWNFLYDTGTSALDSLTAAGISVVTTPAVGAAVLGGSAAASTANDLLDRGATGGQVVLGSVAAGVFEGLFEKISLGNLKSLATKSAPAIIKELGWSKAGVKNLAKEIGKTVFVNASEEMNTEIANIIYDGLMNGELSQYATTVQQYVSEGDSIEDAKRKASQEITEQVVTAGLSGGLMGFGFGGLGTASGGISNALANNKIGRTILSDKNKLDSFKSMAKTSANESIVSAVNKLSISSKASDVGREFRRYASEVINDAKSQLINELKKNGASEKGDNSAGVLAEKIINTVLEPDSVQNKAAKILIASNDIAGSVYMDFVHNGNFGGNDIKQLSNIIKSSSRNVKNIDTNNAVVYNNKRGEGYVPTDEFRELQATSKGMSEEERRRYLRGGANETVRDRISAVFKRQLDTWRSGGSSYNGLLNLTAKGNQFNIYENVDGRIFHDIFEITRNYLQNGELVDLHEVETTENGIGYDDCYNYLSEDGLSGFSITPDGDLISVFNASGKKGFLRAIAPIVKEKAKTLDCYVSPQQNLMEMYEKSFGFKTASLMDYNMEYDHDNIAENHSSPQIAFMVNTPQEVEVHHFNENQYEEAVQYRDSFVLDSDNSVVNNDKEGIVSVDNSETAVAKESPSKTDSTKNISKKIYGRTKQSIEEQKNAVEIGKRLGLEVDFNYKGRANGKITGNKVSINPNAKDPIAFILKHEFLHYLENSKNFDKFLNYVLNDSPAFKQWLKGKNFNSLASAIQDVYNRYGNIGYSKAKIEVVGDFVGDKLFGPRDLKIDENFLKELQKSNRNIFERILDWIKSRIRMLKGTPVEKDLIRLEQKMIRLKETLGKDISNDSESDTKHSYAGRKTPVSDLDTLSEAKKLADEGKDPEYIRKKTGWFQGYEGKWRFEIDDSDAEFYLDNLKIGGRYKLGTLMHHNALYKAYPQLKNIDVYITDSNNYKGYADSSQNVIELSLNRNEGDLDKTLIHEVQHLIQNYEQFSAGSSNDYWHKRLSDDISDNFFQKRDNLFKLVDDSGIKNFNRYFLDYDEFSDQDINSPETKKAYEKIINKLKDDKITNALKDYHNAKIEYDSFLKNGSRIAFDAYMNTAGEIEARDVSNRLRYTEQERKNESPNLGEKDVLFIEEPQENSQSTKNESINDEYEYTESQYNNFGWASYNNVITPREREVLLSRYADFKHNKNKYPVTKSGEAVISSSECPDVIMYVTGNISNPQIKKIVRITATNPVDVEIIRSEILNYEYEHISLPYSAFEDAYGTGIFRYYESRDTASFQEYKATREGKDSKTSNKVSRREQNRGRSLSENKEPDRTKSDINHKNGFYQKVLKNNAKASENYTEEQYNNFGWASYNNVITPKEREILFSRYADFKHNKETYPVTKDGEAVIYSSECPDVIMYVSGNISNPKISLIVRIKADNAWDISLIREAIIRNEQEQNLLPFQFVTTYYEGAEILDFHRKRDYVSFRSIYSGGKGRDSQTGDKVGGREQDRGRSLSENKEPDRTKSDINHKNGFYQKVLKNNAKSSENYTEEQYNNFGWASYNNVITPKEREVLLSRYADFKHNKENYPVTKDGEAVISSTEFPDVIMYVSGSISNPKISLIVRIKADNAYDVSTIREDILNNEAEQQPLPYQFVTTYYGSQILNFHKARDYAPFRFVYTGGKGRDSQTGDKVGGREQNRGRSLSENKESNRTKSNVNHKNGFYQKVLKNNAKSSENYTEEQYNNFGWASYNNVITPKEREILFSRYADFKHNKEAYPVTKDGEAVISSSECPDVIMYISGSIGNPKISLIVRIRADYDFNTTLIREAILKNEQEQIPLPYNAIMETYGPGVLDIHSKRRYAPFRSIQGRGEGGHSEAGDSLSGREQNRERKLSENRTNDEAGVDKPAFSIPSDDDISYENLFKMVENGEITSDEAIDMLNSRYGRIETGVDPKVDVKIPKKISEAKNVRRYVRTAAESGHLDDGMTTELKKNIVKGALAYQPISDQAAMNKADKTVKEDFKGAVQRWESIVSGDKTLSKFDITLGERLLQQAAENGATSDVIKYIAELAEVGTRMGQNIQALSLLKKMTGIGQLYYIQRSVDSLNRDIEAKYKGKKAEVKIDPDYAQILADSKTQQDTEDIVNDMLKDIADQVPSSFLDKWNAWRYMSMLGNPRTHIRNIVGNAVFLPTVRLKDAIAYVMEKTVSPEKRTKSFLVKRQYRKFAEQDFDQMYNIITGGGKMNPADRLREQQRIFNNKALEGSRRLIFNALEKEDAVFLKRHYVHALGSFLQARNLDVSSMSAEDLNKARVYAVKEAQKATYRDASDVASALGRFQYSNKKTVRALGYFVEGILPFKKTPINILKRGIEYSPAGLLLDIGKGLKSLIDYKAIDKRIKNGEITEQQGAELKAAGMTASEFIDGLASGLTGTGIMVLGMLLQSLGVLTGGLDDDEDDELERMTGAQEYSLTVNGHSYTIDWMAPSVLPFLVGGEIAKYFSDTDSESGILGRVIDALTAIGEPLINLSMLSGLNDTIEAVAYSDNKLTDMIITTALSYLSQAIPTLGGQIARTADDTRRTNYVDKNSEIPSSIQMFLQKSAGKIPFLENQKVPYINEWGEMESNGSILNRALENFVSPGYYNKIETDRLNSEIARLYTETDNKDVIPKRAAKSFSVDGKTKYLSAEEYLDYATEKGRRSRKYAEDLITHPLYNDLNDFEKAEALKNLYDYANAVAKLKVPDYELSSSYSKIKDLEENGLDPVDYYIAKVLTDVSRADKDGSWTVNKSEYIRALNESGLSEETQKQLINNRYPKKTK